MPAGTKDLTVRVKLDTSKAEAALSKFQKKISQVNKAIEKSATANNKMERAINKAATTSDRLARSTEKTATAANKVKTALNGAATAGNKMNNAMQRSSSNIDNMLRNIRRIYVLYMGIVGLSKALNVVDQVTAAENRLNYVNNYDTAATEADMKKMYNSAMKTRSGYLDMVSNVSKSMALAGGAFGGNMDNAIRFQEIMSEAYTIGGATTAEKSASMGQMVQALGAGVLAGDELKAVREGAPLAYKAIEKFAQGVYHTTDSLKDMGSEGKINSEIVVAAILDAGQQMDDAFSKTAMTFGQAFQLIQNKAVEAFRPVMEAMTRFLNSETGQQILAGIMKGIDMVAGALTMLFNFISEHAWAAKLLLTAITVLLGILAARAVLAMAAFVKSSAVMMFTFASQHMMLTAVITLLGILIFWIYAVSDSAEDACGIVLGRVYQAVAIAHNIFAVFINWLYMSFAAVFDFLTNAFVTVVAGWLSKLQIFAKAIDFVMGTDLSGKLTGLTTSIRNSGTHFTSERPMQYWSLDEAYSKGYSKGSSYMSNLKNSNLSLASGAGLYSGYDLNNLMDPSTAAAVDGIADDTGKIKKTTDDMADSMQLSEEYLKLLRQIAEDSWKRNATSVNIEVAMNNQATVKSEGDLDGLVTKLTKKLEEELSATAAGVYA